MNKLKEKVNMSKRVRPKGEGCWDCLRFDKGECLGYENCRDTVVGFEKYKTNNDKKMKLGIIGMGYWGNIIKKNLLEMGYNDITECDIDQDYRKVECDVVFVATPASTHFEICRHFLIKDMPVFCEKPLTLHAFSATQLYDFAEKASGILFVDWIFTFNCQVNTIKKDYESGKLGKIKSVTMNRLNDGPVRTDVSARWDLASHDVSILQYLFNQKPKRVDWHDHHQNIGIQPDSSLGLLQYVDFTTTVNDFTATINVSWGYGRKVRKCIFEFEECFVVWDDDKKTLRYESDSMVYYPITPWYSPLRSSIKSFFDFTTEKMLRQKELTLQVIKILQR